MRYKRSFSYPICGVFSPYNYPCWGRSTFARFAIPILPFAFLALYRRIPKDRRLLWTLGVASPLLAASSAPGIVSLVPVLREMVS